MIKEKRFIKECIKTYLDSSEEDRLRKAFMKLSTDQINQLTAVHSLGGLMYYLFLKNNFDNCPISDSSKILWKKSAWDKSLSNSVNDTEAARLAAIFDSKRIDYSYIKGAVCRKFYPEDYIRSSVDIDFFIPPENYEKAKKVLLENSYEIPTGHYENIGISMTLEEYEKIADEIMFINNSNAVQYIVDLQWNMINFGKNSIFSKLYDINEIINNESTHQFMLDGYPMRTLPLEKQLLIMVFHYTFHHGFRGLKWMIDIFSYIKNCGMTPDELVEGMPDDSKKLIGIMYMMASEYTALPKLTKKQKKTVCLDKLVPLELAFYKGLPYKTKTGVMKSIEHRIVKACLPYRFISRIKSLVYLLFDPSSLEHRLHNDSRRNKWMHPFSLFAVVIKDLFQNRKKTNEKNS